MFVNFSEEAKHILKQAEKEKDELNHPFVGSEHLLLSVLNNNKLSKIFKKYKLTYNSFKEELIKIIGIGSKKNDFLLYTPLLKRIIENSVIEARESNKKYVDSKMLIISILNEEDGIAFNILKKLNVNTDKLYFELKKNDNKSNKYRKSLLDESGVDITRLAKQKKLDPTIGRDKEIEDLIQILLRRKKNNPILIGEAGVGKTAIVEGLANIISSNNCPKFLKNKRIISLNMFSLVSGTKYRGEFEEKMKNLIYELEHSKDIIVFIDEIHTLVGAGGAEGAIDASNILKPALARGTIKIIGATTLDEYKKYIEPDAALSRRFQNIYVKEPELEDVIKILSKIKPIYEKHHNIILDNNLIKDIVYLSDKYLSNRFEPDRSIDILDEVCAKVSIKKNESYIKKSILYNELKKIKEEKTKLILNNKFDEACILKQKEIKILKEIDCIKLEKNVVLKEDIMDVIKSKGNIKLYNIKNDYYNNIKNKLLNTIYGQENNIEKLINLLRKKDILKEKKCTSILIEGMKSTGKSLLANEYLKLIYSKKNILNIDLSLYKEYHTISKLIGTTAGYLGYDNKNNVFEKIRTNPNYGIIVDNFDMACDEVQNMFLKIIKDGKIEDSAGKNIDFSMCTIIFIMNDNEEEKLGFSNKKSSINDDSILKDKVDLKISMNRLNDDILIKIIRNELDKSLNKYNLDVTYSNNYVNYVLSKIKKNSLSKLNYYIEFDFENKIVDAMINKKDKLYIDKTSNVKL